MNDCFSKTKKRNNNNNNNYEKEREKYVIFCSAWIFKIFEAFEVITHSLPEIISKIKELKIILFNIIREDYG